MSKPTDRENIKRVRRSRADRDWDNSIYRSRHNGSKDLRFPDSGGTNMGPPVPPP